MQRCAFVVSCVLLGGLCGCAASPWEQNFDRAEASAPARQGDVRVREIPWTRMKATLDQLDQSLSASDTHYTEWTEDQRNAHKARLLKGLQVSGDPASIEILGQSQFRTTEGVSTKDLESFARKVGATTVVWSATHLGKADTVRSEPVTEWVSGSWTGRRRADGTRDGGDISETRTTWVPVRVKEDEYGYVAFYVYELAR